MLIRNQLFGFLVAGHETSATTMSWTLKVLAEDQDTQSKLRSALHSAFPTAKAEARPPTYQEIIKTTIPYLDAVTEEAIRFSRAVPAVGRQTTVDTQVLGHLLPKGTEVIILTNGPSIFSPPFPIDDKLRSAGCLSAKDRIGSWDPEGMAEFKPERWLKEENGKLVFDPAAGPMLIFGLGPRACAGRRLAYIMIRFLLVLLVWGFEVQRCPEELSGLAGVENMTRMPQKCYVRLMKL